MQPADRADHLQNLARGTGGGLHVSNFIGSEREGFGFEDGLGRARKRNRARDQQRHKDTHVCCPAAGATIIAALRDKFHVRWELFFRQRRDKKKADVAPAFLKRSKSSGVAQYLAATGPPQPKR